MAPSNPDEFDGYRKWLGITDKKRPPTHYELLAISLDEDDPEVIRAAAEQRRHYVETKRGDGHDSVVTEILFAIGEAEATLLNDKMRRDYDRQLNLFEKRRKNRQVDPYAPRSRVSSIPGRTVGEDSGIVRTFVGIMAVICVGFGGMAWFSFQLPWSKKPEQPIAAAPVLPVVEPRKADEHAPLATPSPDAILDSQPNPNPPTEQKPQPTFLTTLPRIGLRSHPNDWWSDKGELVLGGTNGTSFIRRPLMFEGRPSPHGIYMSGLISSKVFVKYRLDGRFETFESTVHVPDMLAEQGDPRTPLVFQVVADENTLLWQSNPLKKKGDHQPCVVSVKGVNVLSLKIDCQGPDNWALGAWIEPQVYGTAMAITPPTAAASPVPPVEAKRLDMPLPEFLNLDEINSEEAEASPWISPDGLILYWTAKEIGGKDGDDWIWSAIRKTPDARFEAKTKLFRGKFPVVSSDGLEIIFKPNDIDGFSVATRKSVSEPFARPRQITELSIAGSYSKPRCLSQNGRSLYFDRDKPNGKNNETWVTTRENRGAKWQAPTPLKYAIPGASQEARFTQVCLTQNELHMFCTAALPKTGTEEDVHPAVLSRKTPDGEFTSYQRLTLGNYARDISGWRAFRYCETTREFVITDKGRKNDLFLVRNVLVPVVEEQAQNSSERSDKETGVNEAVAGWRFWDVFGNGLKQDMLIVARDGMLLSPAHDKGFCLTTLKEYSEMDFRMEFQFQTGDGLANPYVGVVSTLPNPAASDWKQQIPRSIQIKLDPKVAGELVLPTADFKVTLNEVQKVHNARHIAPINRAEVKLREWNTLEVKCTEDSKLIIKINGVTVNRLEGMQTNKGHVVIWPANAEMRLRNAVVAVDGSETKLSFETLE